MSKAIKRAALYVRVSTDHQSVENQIRELKQVAEVFRDAGVSGAKGRDQRPGLDALLKDAGFGAPRRGHRDKFPPRDPASTFSVKVLMPASVDNFSPLEPRRPT